MNTPPQPKKRSRQPLTWQSIAFLGMIVAGGIVYDCSRPGQAAADDRPVKLAAPILAENTDETPTTTAKFSATDTSASGTTSAPISTESTGQESTGQESTGHEKQADSQGHGNQDSTKEGADHDGGAGHPNVITPLLLALVVILLAAKIAGDLFERVGMPAVLGELVVGILLGNALFLTNWTGIDLIQTLAADAELLKAPAEHVLADPYSTGAIVKMLAGIGVVLLLFEVGLESSVHEMLSVGKSAMLVAVLGVIAPALLGYGVGLFFTPDHGWEVHAFLGATLCATSVGITARVLKDLGRSQQREAKIILGAAVIDDVLGLVVLAVVSGLIKLGANFDPFTLLIIIGKALGFLAAAVFLGTRVFARPLYQAASYLRGHSMLVAATLVICFGFSWMAAQIGLEPIVGAFAAGLILERAHYRELGKRENIELEEALAPLTALLVPIFFVQMGLTVDLSQFKDPSVWGLAGALTLAAIIGKQVCSFGVLEKGLDRLSVGLGMIPRGEVGLIFASIGKGLKTGTGENVINDTTYSAIVVMVVLTTMVTPPLLKWSMNRGKSPDPAAQPPG